MTEPELLPSPEWEKRLGIKIHDPDGWRGRIPQAKAFDEPISEEEFRQRAMVSTIERITPERADRLDNHPEFRVGGKQPGNLYRNDKRWGFTILDEDGPMAAAALNAYTSRSTVAVDQLREQIDGALRDVADLISVGTAGHVGYRLTRAVEAVLAVVSPLLAAKDVEIERLRDKAANAIADQAQLKGLSVEDGAAVLELAPPRELVIAFVDAARKMLGNAENYSETRIDFPAVSMEIKAAGEIERYVFTAQRAGKLTPHEARKQVEAERDDLRSQVADLARERDEALGRNAILARRLRAFGEFKAVVLPDGWRDRVRSLGDLVRGGYASESDFVTLVESWRPVAQEAGEPPAPRVWRVGDPEPKDRPLVVRDCQGDEWGHVREGWMLIQYQGRVPADSEVVGPIPWFSVLGFAPLTEVPSGGDPDHG